jgi:hypothetical protein
MKINIYINDQLYKTLEDEPEGTYNPKKYAEMVLEDKANNLLTDFDLSKGLGIRIEKL